MKKKVNVSVRKIQRVINAKLLGQSSMMMVRLKAEVKVSLESK